MLKYYVRCVELRGLFQHQQQQQKHWKTETAEVG